MSHNIVIEPTRWDITRRGGVAKRVNGDPVVLAYVMRTTAARFTITFTDREVESAANDLDHLKPGAHYDTYDEACTVALKVIGYALELKWARDAVTQAVQDKHGVTYSF